jgi:hypothetical protein
MKQINKIISTQGINFTYVIWVGAVIQLIMWYKSVNIIGTEESFILGFPGWFSLMLALGIFSVCVLISIIDHKKRVKISVMQMIGLFFCSTPIYLIVNGWPSPL